jgi:hypothetical protein
MPRMLVEGLHQQYLPLPALPAAPAETPSTSNNARIIQIQILSEYANDIKRSMYAISKATGFHGAYTDFKILDKSDAKVASLPAQLVELTYRGKYATAETRGIYLITLADGTTGYRVSYENPVALTPAGQLPPFAKTIFDSFEVIP